MGVLLLLAGFAFVVWREFPDLSRQAKGYSFADTLPKAVEAAGADARVLSILDQDGNESFVLVTRDGRLLERYYGEVCTSSADGPGNACSQREKHDSRRATARERRAAVVPLGELDADVVDELRDQSGAAKAESIGLRGKLWAIAGAHEGVAAVDGSGLHPPRSAVERAAVRSVGEDAGLR